MELLRLRRRLILAQRGHKLLQDKLEEMMRRFIVLLKDIDSAKEDFRWRMQEISQGLLYCRITTSEESFKESLSQARTQIALGIFEQRIMNIKVPVVSIERLKIDKHYDFFNTSAQLDVVLSGALDYLESLLKLAGLLKALDILSFEIERTRRRVNALEYILIPSIADTIRSITHKLNEFERGNLVRLMRVKEIVRAH
jgi:V/A-type H+-transporting ATPase subunit D